MMFVSYSRSDIVSTRALVESLATEGVECWLDESNIPVGQAFVERLGVALREADCFLLVDTTASRASYWVSRELQTSFRYRRDGRYHSALRVYSLDCERTDVGSWDDSVPVNQRSADQIAKFLAGRRTPSRAPDPDRQLSSVSFLNNSGLGQPSYWTGRQDALRLLDQWWFGSLPGAWLLGLGGSGKSGLLQTWVTALSFLGYGEPVSASILYLRGSDVDVTKTQHILSTWESRMESPWRLLLLDGYDEARNTWEMDDILAKALHLGDRLLVTSRSSAPELLDAYFTKLTLANMTRQDSVAILSQFGVTGPGSEELAAELDDHPLALFLLSRSLVRENKTAAEALEDLRRKDLSSGGDGTSSCIRAILRNSVGGLSSDARLLLESLCRSAGGTAELFALAPASIRELALSGLVQVDNLEGPSKVSIHPLVRRYVNQKETAAIDGRLDERH